MPRAATPDLDDSREGDAGDGASEPTDHNQVRLVGRVTTAPQRRVLPSGDELVVLGISVRRPDLRAFDAVPIQVGPAPAAGQRPKPPQVGRRLLATAERLDVGDRVEIAGVLRRRWWEAGGARRSRLEVVADRVERAPTVDGAAADGT